AQVLNNGQFSIQLCQFTASVVIEANGCDWWPIRRSETEIVTPSGPATRVTDVGTLRPDSGLTCRKAASKVGISRVLIGVNHEADCIRRQLRTMSSLGVCNFKGFKFDVVGQRDGNFSRKTCINKWVRMRPLQYAPLPISSKPKKGLRISNKLSIETDSGLNAVDGSEESKSLIKRSYQIPNLSEIKSLVSEICDTNSIAEVELKLGTLHLHVTRDLTEKAEPSVPQTTVASPAAVNVGATIEAGSSNGSVPSTALVVSKEASPSPEGIKPFLDRAADEGIVILPSPRVGVFQRSRTIKGKRTPPACKEKQIVKEGQVLCYVQQLGGEVPVESDVSGEVIRILRKEGEAVGYGDPLIAILPSFPGIKKLQ
ncbi:unnamed protein product, partial [Linum tenue]